MLGYDFNHKLHRCERGVVMVFFAILLPLLFGFMGLSLDAGLAYVEKGKAQDIADAAALAGAAHLSDEDRDTTVKDAVKAYVEANGITLGDNDLVKKADDSAWNTKETLATGKDSIVAWGIVTVTKDGETKDRVRVRITKRVPVVFLSMVDGIADNIVVSAKAAAEGGGEEEVVAYSGPKVLAGQIDFTYLNNNNIKVKSGNDFSVFAYSNIDYKGLPKNATGTIYSSSQNYDNVPDGYQLVAVGQNYHYTSESEKKASKEAMALHEQKKEQYANTYTQLLSDVESYKRGDANKRYIGPDTNGHWGNDGVYIVDEYITNIKDTDTTDIDLYFDMSNFAGLTNDLLKNIKYVKRLVVAHNLYGASIIGTEKIRFGDIYANCRLHIAGNQNYFDGLVYSQDQLYLIGKQNRFWVNPVSSEACMFSVGTAHFGYGIEIVKPTKPSGDVYGGNGWHIFIGEDGDENAGGIGSGSFGSGSGESGSESEGTSTTGKLRLVE